MKSTTRVLLAAAIAVVSGAGWSAENSQAAPVQRPGVPANADTARLPGATERRVLSTSNQADVVDLNIIPSNLLARMDVVTGGAVSYGTGPRPPPVQRVISCNFTMHAWPSPAAAGTMNGLDGGMSSVLVNTMGDRTSLPSQAGETLTACSSAGTGDEVLLVFSAVKDGRSYNVARVVDKSGGLLAEAELERAGTVKFTVAGKQYVAPVPAPGTANR